MDREEGDWHMIQMHPKADKRKIQGTEMGKRTAWVGVSEETMVEVKNGEGACWEQS